MSEEYLKLLTPEQIFELKYDWGFFGRGKQQPPDGDGHHVVRVILQCAVAATGGDIASRVRFAFLLQRHSGNSVQPGTNRNCSINAHSMNSSQAAPKTLEVCDVLHSPPRS